MMITETTLLRLPPPVSDAVDDAVNKFTVQGAPVQRRAHYRWHGADIWMILQDDMALFSPPPWALASTDERDGQRIVFADRPVGLNRSGLLTRRLTVGAFSDRPDTLTFVPDWLLSTREGRYVASPDDLDENAFEVSIFDLTRTALTNLTAETALGSRLLALLQSAWARTEGLPVRNDVTWAFVP